MDRLERRRAFQALGFSFELAYDLACGENIESLEDLRADLPPAVTRQCIAYIKNNYRAV